MQSNYPNSPPLSHKRDSRSSREKSLFPQVTQAFAKEGEFLPRPLVILIKAVIGNTNGKLIVFGPEVKQ